MKLYIDFETRSLADLPTIGAWKYAQHESTYPLMLAVLYGDTDRSLQWLEYKHGRQCPDWIREAIEDDEVVFSAWNMEFEYAIWREVLHRRWGWPMLPLDRCVDSMAQSAYANRPQKLERAAKAVKAKVKKDTKGKALIDQLSQPRRAVKAKKDEHGEPRKDNIDYLKSKGVEIFEYKGNPCYWENNAALLRQFAKYNVTDVLTERAVGDVLPDMPESEQDVWRQNLRINARGVPADLRLCDSAVEIADDESERASDRLHALTDGKIRTAKQYQKIADWVRERVPDFGPSVAAPVVQRWLLHAGDSKAENEVKDLFKLCEIAGGAAIKKYKRAQDSIATDGRIRGLLNYHGASTGRWASRGMQVHNFARVKTSDDLPVVYQGYDAVFDYSVDKDIEPTEFLKRCVRGIVKAEEDKTLVISDFAGIEARVVQWFAGAEKVLQAFRTGDAYVQAASNIFKIPYDEMMADGECKPEYKDKRQIGKIATLGLGYNMGAPRYKNTCKEWADVDIDLEFAKEVVWGWRRANPLIARKGDGLWDRVEGAMKHVIENPKCTANVRNRWGQGVIMGMCDDSGWIQLPTGRKLWYPEVHLVPGDRGLQIAYRDPKGMLETTYGGCLVENIVQGMSRDLLVNSMRLIEMAGIEILFHVHDEVVTHVPKATVDTFVDIVHSAMETVPRWAKNLPLEAETFHTDRFTK